MMLIPIALVCLIGLASANPIQMNVLKQVVAQRSTGREQYPDRYPDRYPDTDTYPDVHQDTYPEVYLDRQQDRYTGQQRDTLESFTPVLPPVTELPLKRTVGLNDTVTQVTETSFPAVIGGEQQTATQSSSESESLESESVEESPETIEEPASDTSEQTLESQETSENMTSEEGASHIAMQLTHHTDSDGDLRDDSRGSEENIRRNWIRAFTHHILHRVHARPFKRIVENPDIPVEAVTVSVADTGAVGVTDTGTVGVVTERGPTPSAATTGVGVVLESDSIASESKESEEDLEQIRACGETVDNGACTAHGEHSHSFRAPNHLPLHLLRLEHGHMII